MEFQDCIIRKHDLKKVKKISKSKACDINVHLFIQKHTQFLSDKFQSDEPARFLVVELIYSNLAQKKIDPLPILEVFFFWVNCSVKTAMLSCCANPRTAAKGKVLK